MPIGFTLPFAKSTGSLGYFEATQDEISAVRENLKSLLLTNWGERVMHYNFGCNLKEFLFQPRTDELRDRISDRVQTQISTWLRFITVDELQVFFAEDSTDVPDNGVGVHIKFRLTERPDLTSLLDIVVPG